jgi:hypothetical protein
MGFIYSSPGTSSLRSSFAEFVFPHSYTPDILDPEQGAAFLAFPELRAVFSHRARKDELVEILPNPRSMRDSVCIDFPFKEKLSFGAVFDNFTAAP